MRISGKVTLTKDRGYDNLLFPFGNVNVAGEELQPGDFIRLVRTEQLDAELDCLLVVVPELKDQSVS